MNEDFDAVIGAAAMPRGLADKRVTESMDLAGRVAVVTGGGGINMGSACVDRLASLGTVVVALDLNAAAAKVAADSPRRNGAPVVAGSRYDRLRRRAEAPLTKY